MKIAGVVFEVYEGGDEVFSDKSYLNRDVLIGSSEVNWASGPNQWSGFKPTRNPTLLA